MSVVVSDAHVDKISFDDYCIVGNCIVDVSVETVYCVSVLTDWLLGSGYSISISIFE